MPWDRADATRFSKKAKGKEGKWARTANAVLKQTGDDAKAIKLANAAVHPKRPKS
jgi:hypothetical protein